MIRRKKLVGWMCAAAIATTLATARADTITLKTGEKLEGLVRLVDGGYEITVTGDAAATRRFIATEDVKSLKLTNQGKTTEADARERLSSLQRSVESEKDLKRIIARYQQFIQMNADTEAAKLAEADLKTWQTRRDQQMVKVGRRWLTPAQRDADLVEVANQVQKICELLDANQPGEAGTLLRRGLEANPDNVSFLYLNGVMQLERNAYTDARRSFELVNQQIEQHAPTLINIALLNVQFKRWPQAITSLEQAMASAPVNPEVLDNVLEFSKLAPENSRRGGSVFERMMSTFTKQEAELERQMAAKQLYRWGSKWVDQATLDKAKQEQVAYEKKKTELQADFDATNTRLKRTQEKIQTLENLIRAIESQSVYTDPVTGRAVRQAYPASYWGAQRDLDQLNDERRDEETHVAEIRKNAADLEANAPKPPFDGRLTPIGSRGVPVILPAGASLPTTAPATAPSTRPSHMTDWRVPMQLPK